MSADRGTIVEQTYFDVELRSDGIVWLRRKDQPYPNLNAVGRAYDEFLKVVDDWLLDRRIKSGALGTKARTPMSWLYDVRNAPQRRHDPAFEAVVQQRRSDLLTRSPLLCVLVRTAAGRMQLNRMTGHDRDLLRTLDDPDTAMDWLREEMNKLPR